MSGVNLVGRPMGCWFRMAPLSAIGWIDGLHCYAHNVRIKLGSVAFLAAAGSGYGIGLDEDGHRVEFLGDWRALVPLQAGLEAQEPTYVDVEPWQVLAVDDELRLPLTHDAMVERARFLRSALRGAPRTT